MHITTITYARVRNLGNYENERIEATATLDYGEEPNDALDDLREWVGEQMGLTDARLLTVAPVTQATTPPAPAATPQPEKATTPAPGRQVRAATAGGGQATPAQVNAIYSIGRREYRWSDEEMDTYSRSAFGKLPVDLTKREASEFIDRLKATAPPVE